MPQLWAAAGAVLAPALVALWVLGGEPWRYLDRPLYAGGLLSRDPDFSFDVSRGFIVSVVYGLIAATAVALELIRRRAGPDHAIEGGMIIGIAVVVLAPLTHAVWLADAMDTSRLAASPRHNLELFRITASEWSQAAPYVLLSVYGIVALVVVLGLVGIHAQERDGSRRRVQQDRPIPPHRPWSAH